MTPNVLFILDPIEHLNWKKDSSLALIEAMKKRGWQVWVVQPNNLWLDHFEPFGMLQQVDDLDFHKQTIALQQEKPTVLKAMQFILVRQDPPVDDHYLFITHLLEQAQQDGCRIINAPQALRDANEKLFTAWFKTDAPASIISQNKKQIIDFTKKNEHTILKPLNQMGGQGIVKTHAQDPNLNSLIELLTHRGTIPIMAQVFLPEIKAGDRRILLIHGHPIDQVLIRQPSADDFRGNMAAGGLTSVGPIHEKERIICEKMAPRLQAMGLFFVGLDIIGHQITEINVTSPTGIREIEAGSSLKVTDIFLDAMEKL